MQHYQQYNPVVCHGQFYARPVPPATQGALYDPQTVKFLAVPTAPGAAPVQATWTNGGGATQGIITRNGIGDFEAEVWGDPAGAWHYAFWDAADPKGPSRVDTFEVDPVPITRF